MGRKKDVKITRLTNCFINTIGGSEAKERSHRCRGQGKGRSLEFPRRLLPGLMIKLSLKDEQVRGGRASSRRNSVCSALSRGDTERLVWKWAVDSGADW